MLMARTKTKLCSDGGRHWWEVVGRWRKTVVGGGWSATEDGGGRWLVGRRWWGGGWWELVGGGGGILLSDEFTGEVGDRVMMLRRSPTMDKRSRRAATTDNGSGGVGDVTILWFWWKIVKWRRIRMVWFVSNESRVVEFEGYFFKIATKSLLSVFGFIAIRLSIGLLGSFAFGRWLLLKFLSIFTFGGFRKKVPTEKEVAIATFKMWFVGYGFSDAKLVSLEGAKSDTKIITRVMGPEIGYLTTPIVLIQCALIVLKQRQDLPKGGVLTPGIIFDPFDLQDRLQENGISFDLISEK
ncbi:hypothetical protein HanOQP8_Chr10g0371741 [Helianthus annuus]|nr:hypothetical protein HanOQP8_Chr10g0371741 [Helianthus annuus]KAJ0884369.1 hypothetical protein HanPSC8_Chr10g0432901 [Helianthus annuus]